MQSRDQVIQHLTEHLGELEAKRNRLVQDVEREIEHVRGTIASLRGIQHVEPLQNESLPFVAEFPIAKIRNMTQVQALVTIARHSNGVIRAQEAKRLLIRAGVMRETKNSTNIIHAVIMRSDKFERIRPGEYRLKELNPKVDATAQQVAVQ
jgi:hypothetical protein